MTEHRLNILAALASEVARKRHAPPSESYTAKLISQGVEKCAKKFGEEAVELAIAAVGTDTLHVTAEAADVLYHLLVLLEAKNVKISDVMAELERRQGTSGLAEKAARKAD
jgi:phosphoribosyl-ATP pyrophosphohydrolase